MQSHLFDINASKNSNTRNNIKVNKEMISRDIDFTMYFKM